MATITGTTGDDFLEATTDANTLIDASLGDDFLIGLGGDDTLLGGFGNDDLFGGDGNDSINPGDNEGGFNGFDFMTGSFGDDTYDLSDVEVGYVAFSYTGAPGPNGLSFNINGVNNTATVDKGVGGTDTIIDIINPLRTGYFEGGVSFRGTDFNDVFTINLDTEQWMSIRPNGGDDLITVTTMGEINPFSQSGGDLGSVRLDYRFANQGMVVNLNTGVISQDGFGGTDTIIGRVWELRAGAFDDDITGSSNAEAFILNGGNDTVDGGGGIDRVRYNRSNEDTGIDADLLDTTNTVRGTTDGNNFVDSLTNIEWLIGTRFGDEMRGTNGRDIFWGEVGNDTLVGRDGNDILRGESGDDSLVGNAGNDRMFGGAGGDILKGFGGKDKLYGDANHDFLDGGTGRDTLNGGEGDDTLTGGNGDDDFIFKDNFGNDTITDFNEFDGGEDIVLRGVSEIESFNDLITNHMTQQGNDVLIDDLEGNTILIQNVLLADLDKLDFLF